jgi:hypothetical protein
MQLHMPHLHAKDKAIANALILIKCKKVEHLVVEGLVDPCSQMLRTTYKWGIIKELHKITI